MINFNFKRKNKGILDEFRLVRTEFDGKIVLGKEEDNIMYGSFLSSSRVANMYDSDMKLMVLAKGINKEKSDSLVRALSEWFKEEDNTDINSREFNLTLMNVVRGLKIMATIHYQSDDKTSLGFAISNGRGDAVIFNVGGLNHYIKRQYDDYLVDVTAYDPASTAFSSLEDTNGSFFYYSDVEEIYTVPEGIPEYDIQIASDYKISVGETVNHILYMSSYLTEECVDKGVNVLKIRKR